MKKKNSNSGGLLLIVALVLAFFGVLWANKYHMPKYKSEFLALEKQRIDITNKLTTAKIVQENLNHVRDLIFSNISFPGQPDTIDHETQFFNFVTTSVQELKLKLVAVKPVTPQPLGRVTTYAYDVEVEGDFFRFGELCAKFENNRRIISIESFDVDLLTEGEVQLKTSRTDVSTKHKDIRVRMRINTYRVSKG